MKLNIDCFLEFYAFLSGESLREEGLLYLESFANGHAPRVDLNSHSVIFWCIFKANDKRFLTLYDVLLGTRVCWRLCTTQSSNFEYKYMKTHAFPARCYNVQHIIKQLIGYHLPLSM